jgi:hypothetical protein
MSDKRDKAITRISRLLWIASSAGTASTPTLPTRTARPAVGTPVVNGAVCGPDPSRRGATDRKPVTEAAAAGKNVPPAADIRSAETRPSEPGVAMDS